MDIDVLIPSYTSYRSYTSYISNAVLPLISVGRTGKRFFPAPTVLGGTRESSGSGSGLVHIIQLKFPVAIPGRQVE